MNTSGVKPDNGLQGIAALFNDIERKEIFRKYLYFLGWVEALILLTCWLYQIGDSGSPESTFPWRLYFIIAFLAPVAISFLVGIIIVGFNKYFGEPEAAAGTATGEQEASQQGGSGKIHQINRMVTLVQKLPFLALLLLLALAVGFFYKLDAIVSVIGSVGEKSVKVFLISGAVILILVSIFALILVILNYKLRKKSMEYQYKSQVAERFGLIILEDNTVMNSQGKLLVNGKKWKDAVPMLPEPAADKNPPENPGPAPRPVDLET